MSHPNGNVSEEEFIKICQTSKTNEEGAQRAKVTIDAFRKRRASVERRRGMNLRGSLITNRIKEIGYSEKDWSVAWDKTDGLSVLVHNPDYITRDEHSQALRDAVDAVRKVAPKFPTPKYVKTKTGHLVIINVTDLHLAAWGLDKAVAVLERAVDDALSRSSGYEVEKILIVIGSDVFHFDNAHYTTTKGTPMETDGSSWAQMFKAGQSGYTSCIARAASVAPVHVVHAGGNHDEVLSWALAQVLEATFSKAKNITFDVSDTPRKYFEWHDNLIVITHGDKVKDAELPLVISHEAAEMWGRTKFRYVYLGHFHGNRQIRYQSIKDMPGITLQWLRSPKPTDKWHRDMGYLGQQGVTSFIHSRDGGQVASLSINL
jgi:hypothetical protein